MSSLDDKILEVLKVLDQKKALKHLIIIGSWVTLFYRDYFKDQNYHPTIRTTDIDFLIPKKPLRGLSVDLSSALKGLGFSEKFSSDGLVTFSKPDLDVEFLYPRIGRESDKPKTIQALGVNARPLRYMSLIEQETIQCTFRGIAITLPHPVAYALHKLIISGRRTKDFKRDNDRQQAEMVLTTLSDPRDLSLLQQIYGSLTKKEKKYISDALEGRPLLQEVFRDSQVLKAESLNQLYDRIVDAYKKRGFKLTKKIVWKERTVLHARELNVFLDTVDDLYQLVNIDPPQWSFGRFREGTVLKASQLNEVDRRLKELPMKKDGTKVKF